MNICGEAVDAHRVFNEGSRKKLVIDPHGMIQKRKSPKQGVRRAAASATD